MKIRRCTLSQPLQGTLHTYKIKTINLHKKPTRLCHGAVVQRAATLRHGNEPRYTLAECDLVFRSFTTFTSGLGIEFFLVGLQIRLNSTRSSQLNGIGVTQGGLYGCTLAVLQYPQHETTRTWTG